jgi:hypothetical protein
MKNFFRVKDFESEIGYYTVNAIRHKIKEGVWINGREFVKSPDGHIFISLFGVEQYICSTKPIIPINERYPAK